FQSPTGHPLRNGLDLMVAQTALALKHTMRIHGFPRRHLARLHRMHDRKRLRLRVGISEQRKWSNAAWAVAGLAMLLENTYHLIVERDRIACISRAAAQDKERNCENSSDAHGWAILNRGGCVLAP